MVVPGHGDHRVAVVGHRAALVHGVAADGGGGVAGPVKRVPAPVVRQALHRPHVWGGRGRKGENQGLATVSNVASMTSVLIE